MTKVVFSSTMEQVDGRVVIRGDLAGQLAGLNWSCLAASLRHQRRGWSTR